MARTKKSARKTTGGKPPRKVGESSTGQPKGGKPGKKSRKAEVKAMEATSDPKSASIIAKKAETLIDETPVGEGTKSVTAPTKIVEQAITQEMPETTIKTNSSVALVLEV